MEEFVKLSDSENENSEKMEERLHNLQQNLSRRQGWMDATEELIPCPGFVCKVRVQAPLNFLKLLAAGLPAPLKSDLRKIERAVHEKYKGDEALESDEKAEQAVKLFINMCFSNKLGDMEVEHGKLRLPASFSAPRMDADKSGQPCLVAEAVFSRQTIRSCQEDTEFRRFCCSMALSNYETKYDIKGDLEKHKMKFPKLQQKGQAAHHPQRIRKSAVAKVRPKVELIESASSHDGDSDRKDMLKSDLPAEGTFVEQFKADLLQQTQQLRAATAQSETARSSSTARDLKVVQINTSNGPYEPTVRFFQKHTSQWQQIPQEAIAHSSVSGSFRLELDFSKVPEIRTVGDLKAEISRKKLVFRTGTPPFRVLASFTRESLPLHAMDDFVAQFEPNRTRLLLQFQLSVKKLRANEVPSNLRRQQDTSTSATASSSTATYKPTRQLVEDWMTDVMLD